MSLSVPFQVRVLAQQDRSRPASLGRGLEGKRQEVTANCVPIAVPRPTAVPARLDLRLRVGNDDLTSTDTERRIEGEGASNAHRSRRWRSGTRARGDHRVASCPNAGDAVGTRTEDPPQPRVATHIAPPNHELLEDAFVEVRRPNCIQPLAPAWKRRKPALADESSSVPDLTAATRSKPRRLGLR